MHDPGDADHVSFVREDDSMLSDAKPPKAPSIVAFEPLDIQTMLLTGGVLPELLEGQPQRLLGSWRRGSKECGGVIIFKKKPLHRSSRSVQE